MKIKRTVQFSAFFIIPAAILAFSSCDDKEVTYDNIPAELQNKTYQTGETSYYSFSATTWTYTEGLVNSFTVSNLTVTPMKNNYENKNTYPNGYEITGKVISTNGTYKNKYPEGKYLLYQFFLTPDNSGVSIWYNPNQ
jgi:hypothetical protein